MGISRSVSVSITSADTDTTVMSIPHNKIGYVILVEITNGTASNATVQIWDTYTDVNGDTHRDLIHKEIVTAGTTSVISYRRKSQHVMGTLVAQSDVAGVDLIVAVELE